LVANFPPDSPTNLPGAKPATTIISESSRASAAAAAVVLCPCCGARTPWPKTLRARELRKFPPPVAGRCQSATPSRGSLPLTPTCTGLAPGCTAQNPPRLQKTSPASGRVARCGRRSYQQHSLLSFQIAELLRISALEIDVLLARSTLYFGFWSCTYQHFCQKKERGKNRVRLQQAGGGHRQRSAGERKQKAFRSR
jgi:hypothetical protein